MTRKTGTSTLLTALKATLRSENISYRALADRLKLSESSVKRLFADESFSLKRVEQICDVLNIDFFELARRARGAMAGSEEMSEKQEAALAADPRLLGLFYLVFNEWSFESILESFDVGKAECIGLLMKLDRLGLIDVGPNESLKLRVPKSLRLRRDGPIQRIHGKFVVGDFLQADFRASGGFFHFEFRELSRASVAHLERKLGRIAAEFHELAELDSYLPPEQRETIGMALGVRPWTMSGVTGLKRRVAKPA
ncbi:MAG TPA: helix-turn-helix transcriptional regulator [Usitatibacteraceae bacterium]|nr:helix-turn-helix transcriptional regulator [Usitatibacteraceae bacterium]